MPHDKIEKVKGGNQMTTVEEVYTRSILPLPTKLCLEIAALILKDLARNGDETIEARDDWSEDDVTDVLHFSLQNAQNT